MELTIELTNLCKNNCIHCSSSTVSDADKSVMLPTGKVIETVKHLEPAKVILSGGEPLLHPDIETIIEKMKDLCPVVAVNTCGIFPLERAPRNYRLIDEFYISVFYYENERVTRLRSRKYEGRVLFFTTILKMLSRAKLWFNVVMLFEDQVNDIASMAYHFGVPVHFIKFVPHGRGASITSMSRSDQLRAAERVLDQLNPDRLDKRVPPFLVDDGYDEIVVAAYRDEIVKKMNDVHPRCKISHSLLDGKCRAMEKRTLLPDGRLIGCVAGKGIDERFDIIKTCCKSPE